MIFGKYQLLELIGRGGMAEVYKAKSYGVEGFEKLLVIKRILPNLTDNESFVEMFIDEAKIAVTLNHANIVQVFDLGKVADSYFIAMEFVQGMDLSRMKKLVSANNDQFPVELAAYIVSEAAKGLDYAHRRRDQRLEPLNIVHRDISPQNILVSLEGEVKVTDFGIALAKNTITNDDESIVKGKNSYMAPEQAKGKPHDKRVDIYALGVVLYELISGSNPFRNNSTAEILRMVRNKVVPTLANHPDLENIPGEISDIVAKAMSMSPDDRYLNAGEFYEALISFMYNTGTRVGAHSLTSFVDGLVQEHGLAKEGEHVGEKIRESLDISLTGRHVSSSSATPLPADEVTAIQVPTTKSDEITTSTGTRELAAEMREVTFLVAEFVGPMAPTEVIDRFRLLVEHNGGSIIESNGDLIVALFGLEVADGRDTEDALDTALKIQQSAFLQHSEFGSLQMGVGVYPQKIVLLTNQKPRQDDVYFKGVTNARSLANRSSGWVATTLGGKRLARDFFRFEELSNEDSASGDSIFKVIGRRPTAETYGQIFGRRDELRQIGELLAMVSRGSGRAMALTGDLGLGKTRIMHEVRRRLESGGHDVGWYEGLCMPWRQNLPFSAIANMFRTILGVSEIEPESELRSRVIRLRELGLIPEEVDAVAALLGLPATDDVTPDEKARQLRSALIRAASSLSSDKLTIMLWDDLHYIDGESLDVVVSLSKSISHLPIMLAFSHTPNFGHNWKLGDRFTEIALPPLSESDSKRLSRSRLNTRAVPEPLLMEIALKSGGNPLYIEEYIKALIANDVVRLRGGQVTVNSNASLTDLPKTLQGLVADRVKRLPLEHRGLLQRASVIGQRFSVELLSHVTGVDTSDLRPSLINLLDKGLISRLAAGEFAFSSDLIRDVVYKSIIASDAKDIHMAIGKTIEDIYFEQIDDYVEQLAHHYRESGERRKAEDYLIQAGAKVALMHSHRAALDYYLQALELASSVPEPDAKRLLMLYVPIGDLCVKSNKLRLGLEKLTVAEDIAESYGDKRTQVKIMRVLAEVHAFSSNFAESQQYYQRAIELADELDNSSLRCEVRVTAGKVYMMLGDIKKAAPYLREVIDIWPEDGNRNLLIWTTSQLSKAEANGGEQSLAFETIARAEELIDEHTDPTTRCEFERCRAQIYYMIRELQKSIHYSSKALEIAKEFDLKDQVAANAHNIGDAYVSIGDYRKAFMYLRYSNEAAEEIGYEMVMSLNTIFLSFIDALKFGSNDGLGRLETALDEANVRNTVWEQLQVHYFLGRIYFERRLFEEAKTHLNQSIRVGRSAENKIYDAQAVDLLEQIREIESGTRS